MNKKSVYSKIHNLTHTISDQLLPHYQDEHLCNQYAWWMIEAITKKSKNQLIVQDNILLTDKQLRTLNTWIKKQVNEHTPLHYLIGSVPFLDVEILLEPPILIPRPETEHWCGELIERLRMLGNTPLTILDMCTGSGCIALALAKALPHATIYATDISKKALALAQKNAQHNEITNITFLQSDLFQDIPHTMHFDIIVSNPPYVSQAEWHTLEPSVKDWEDKHALVAPQHGLGILEKIILQAPQFLQPNKQLAQKNIPQLIVEIGHKQGHAVSKLMQQAWFGNVQIIKDLAGKDRVVCGRVEHVAAAIKQK